MTYPPNPAERSPKGDHNRRLSLGLSPEAFAAQAGITVEALHEYESTWPDHQFPLEVAERVGQALERLEALKEPIVDNGPPPPPEEAALGSVEKPGRV